MYGYGTLYTWLLIAIIYSLSALILLLKNISDTPLRYSEIIGL